MTTKTTTSLQLRARDYWMIHETRIRDTVSLACIVGILLIVRPMLSPQPAATPVVLTEAQRPAILVMTATPAPPQPTATAIVEIREVIVQAPAPAPEVIYVPVPAEAAPAPAYAAPTPEPVYQTASEPQAPAFVPTAAPAVQAEEFKEPNRAATCAFVGCLGR